MTTRCRGLPNLTQRRYHSVMSSENAGQSKSRSRLVVLVVSVTVVSAAGLVYAMTRPPVGLADGDVTPPPAGIATTEAGTSTHLVSLRAAGLPVPFDGTLQADASATGITALVPQANLSIAEDGTFTGDAGCNHMFGTVTSTGDRLEFGEIGMTQMMCAPELMTAEHEFTEILTAGASFAVRDGALVLNPGTGQELVFAAK